MSKSSTVTVRQRPVAEVASANVGGLTIHGETIMVSTDQRIELVDLTNKVMEFVRQFNIKEGIVSLWSMHTTCTLFINELKAGQILLASSGAHSDPYEWLTLGVMINVAHHPPNPEPETFNSVHASGAPEVTPGELLEDFARYFLSWINRWAEEGFEPIGRHWQMRADGIGAPLTLRLGQREQSGTFVKLDGQGRLLLRATGQVECAVSVNEYFDLDWK